MDHDLLWYGSLALMSGQLLARSYMQNDSWVRSFYPFSPSMFLSHDQLYMQRRGYVRWFCEEHAGP